MRQQLLLVLACAIALPALATNTPPPPAPKPDAVHVSKPVTKSASTSAARSRSTSTSRAGARSDATGGSVGDIAPQQDLDLALAGDSHSSRALSLFVQPPAFTPPMAQIAGCAPVIKQEARSGWLLLGGVSTATSSTDPTDCTLIDLRNAMVEACQYGSAKQIEDGLAAKLLPGFVPSGVRFEDLPPQACAALKAPPRVAQAENFIAAPPAAAAAPPSVLPAPAVCTVPAAPAKAARGPARRAAGAAVARKGTAAQGCARGT